ncbi:MAG: hypothetical protein Kow0047_07340 [Anaerolineae bacterium]
MPDSRRKPLADVLVTTVMLAAGFATGGPLIRAIAGLAGGIAVNWAADLTWAGWARARDQLLGALTAKEALRNAWAEAFRRALNDLEATWWKTGRGAQMQGEEKAQAKAVFQMLREDADGFFRSPSRPALPADISLADERACQETVRSQLASYQHGHDEQLVAFIEKNLIPMVSAQFAGVLTRDEAAFRAYMSLWQRSTLETLEDVRAGVLDIRASQQEIQAAIERVKAISPEDLAAELRPALEETITQAQRRLEDVMIHEFHLARAQVQEGFDRLSAQIEDLKHHVTREHPPRVLKTPFLAPPLPRQFVPRPEVSEDLKAQLLADEAPDAAGVLVVSAIHGLGGIGKSTLAAALAHDPQVRAHFKDGILWATLGEQPEALSLLSSWIQALGDYDFHPTTLQAATDHLRTLLQDKTALLVVDDVWEVGHARHFLVGGSRCRVLITTREALIARAMGASLYPLDVMTEEQALKLFANRLGRALDGEERAARELAREVGYLPLALELAAGQVAEGVPWEELLADLRAEIARLEALEPPGADEIDDEAIHKRLSLRASFHLSLRRLSSERRERFAWLGITPEDVQLTPRMAATLWDMDESEAREELRYLRDKALLLPGLSVADGVSTYRLHDLLRDLARQLLVVPPPEGLGLSLREAHATFMERYRARLEDGRWHTVPDDGYIHAHLTWHMEQAGWIEEIHRLLREETSEGRNGWYHARERLGQTAGYLADVARAWRLAEEAYAPPPEVDAVPQEAGRAIGLQCRYALIIASINSLARGISPALLAALVKENLWTAPQGLAYARQVPDPWQRARALASLAPHLPQPLLREALAAAQAISDERCRAQALASLAPRLAGLGHPREALAAAQAISDEYVRAEALASLAPHLPQPLLREALAAAQAISNEYVRAEALASLAPHLPEPERTQALREALAAAQAIEWESARAEALASLAPRLAELGHPREALAAAQAISDEDARARALTSLAPRLAEEDRGWLYPLWQETLHVLASRTRKDLLADLRALEPVIHRLGGPEAVAETFRAIQDVGRWWP